MAILKELEKDSSWILKSNTNEKIGIIGKMESIYTLIAPNINFQFNDFKELEAALNEPISLHKKESVEVKSNEIDGFPISHESVQDIERLDNSLIKYSPSTKAKSKKEYYAGLWVTPNSENDLNTWYVRTSISVDIYDKLMLLGITPCGPFKDKMEANFSCRQNESKYRK